MERHNELLYMSKQDIPFEEGQLVIHQPTIREIALIGEEAFFTACQLLFITKEKIPDADKNGLDNMSNFEIFMSIMQKEHSLHRNYVIMVLTLIFPEYKIRIAEREIILLNDVELKRINALNFEAFKKILNSMFLYESFGDSVGYNPIDARASKIAEKLARGKKKLEEQNGTDNKKQKVAVFSRYISILAVGLQKDMNELFEYTVFQLKDEFKRYQMKMSFDMYVQAKMAGAKDIEDVDNWMDDIHP